jgi:thioredoxin-related protein
MADPMKHFLMMAAVCACLAACSKNKPATTVTPGIGSGTGVPPSLMARRNQPQTPSAAAMQGVELTPEDEIVFTDPDNPDASLPELSTLLDSAPRRRGPWEQSETIAKRRAMREGKPMLIWFTDSARSPMCKALSQELLQRPDFEEWASEKIIRLRVDSNVMVDDANLSLDEKETRLIELKRHVARMKKQYKVLGSPVMVMLNPAGEVIGRYRGYKRGDADFTWGLIKQGEAASAHALKDWRASMQAKGYREWSDRNDRTVFAKLARYSDGTLILIEPDGTRSKTHENRISDKDRAWIAEQKRMRGL